MLRAPRSREASVCVCVCMTIISPWLWPLAPFEMVMGAIQVLCMAALASKKQQQARVGEKHTNTHTGKSKEREKMAE